MGCGKSKNANVAAGNTVVTKKKAVEKSSLTSSVSDKVGNYQASENAEKANQNVAVVAENVVEDKKAENVMEEEVGIDAPLVAEEKVELHEAIDSAAAAVEAEVVHDTEKVEEPAEESLLEIVVTEEESKTEIENVEPDVKEVVPSEAITENAQLEVTEAAAVEEETKTTSENVQSEEAAATATTDDSKTASEITELEETEVAAEESK